MWSYFFFEKARIFQLRVNLSPLRSRKKRHKLVDTPSEICICDQGIEGISHLLFSCPIYATQRTNPTVSVIEILQRNNLNHLANNSELYLY